MLDISRSHFNVYKQFFNDLQLMAAPHSQLLKKKRIKNSLQFSVMTRRRIKLARGLFIALHRLEY